MTKNYTIARISRGGETFEVLVDPEEALKFKLGEQVPPSKILVYDQVYRDAKKGIRAKEEELKKFFGTVKTEEIVVKILREGELQVTADQRRRLIEEKKKQIIDFISKNAIDPTTKLPIPPQRIELAMEQVGVPIDPFVDAKQQSTKVLERLKMVLPIKIGLSLFYVRVPGDVYGKALNYIRSVGKIVKEEWLGDGSWTCELEAPAGMLVELVERLAKISSGRAEVRPKEV